MRVREEGAGLEGAGRPGPRRVVRSETGGYAPDREARLVRDHPSREQSQAPDHGLVSATRTVAAAAYGRTRPLRLGWVQWRPLVGVLLAVVGYVLVAIPALLAYDLGVNGPDCETGWRVEADRACFGEPRPASEVFRFFTALVTAPAALGILVAWPRRRGLVLLVLACVALGLYSYLVLANLRT